jgi:glucose-6-phosphate isomerase
MSSHERPFSHEYNTKSSAGRWGPRVQALLDELPAWADMDEMPVAGEALAGVPAGPTLVIGMGGSALGSRAALAMAAAEGGVRHEVRILDTVDPAVVLPALSWAAERRAALQVVSKSGGTVEVLWLLEACLARGLEPAVLVSSNGESKIQKRIAAAGSDPNIVYIPEDIGGRYSVFTAVGQLALHAAGRSHTELVDGARAYLDTVRADPGASPCAVELGWRSESPAASMVVMCYCDALLAWAEWLQQLECESLGRTRTDGSRVGELITVLRAPAAQHSVAQLLLDGPEDKRVIVADFDRTAHDDDAAELARLRAAERDATFDALTLPTQRLLIGRPSVAALGGLMLHGMLVTVLWATELGVSPYGQPAVEAIKRGIVRRLSTSRAAGSGS